MAPACSSISLFPSAQTKNTRDGPTAAFPKDSILSRMGKPRIQPTISFVISFIPAWAGKLDAAHRQLGGDGPIPTHAGKTHSHSLPPITTLAHPRSRGENLFIKSGSGANSGSSPLTRGKPQARRRDRRRRRLIPAHAGKTTTARGDKIAGAAHPRSRGENRIPRTTRVIAAGSSPLTRGKRPPHPVLAALGLAHPRSRGENRVAVYEVTATGGSSPLTRGKRGVCIYCVHHGGLIPAHAGKTPSQSQTVPRCAAHPRSRGENTVTVSDGSSLRGSSPLTRGKPARPCVVG